MSTYRLALLAAALAFAQGASAATLSGSVAPATATVGGMATVNVALDLSDAVELQGFTLNLSWDAGLGIDAANAMVFGQPLSTFVAAFDPMWSGIDTNIPGQLGVAALADLVPPSLAAGPATMSFIFTALATGIQNVHLDIHLTDGNFEDIPLALDGTVTISPVPENSPALMLAAGIGVLGLLARRRRF